VGPDINRQDFHCQNIEERRQGATLSNSLRRVKVTRSVTVDEDGAPNVRVKQNHPLDERWDETHSREGRLEEGPIDVVESLLLVQRQDGKREIRIVGIVSHIPEEGHVLTNEAIGDSAGLITGHDMMNNS